MYEKWAKWELGRTLENPGFSLLLIPMRYILIKQQPTARVSPALHSTTHNTPYSSKSTGHIFEWSREQAHNSEPFGLAFNNIDRNGEKST